jgi:RNA polymerase sigma-70 factor (ECF subfamily)
MTSTRDQSPDDLKELWDAARDGCEESLAHLLENYRPYLLAIANASLEDKVRPKMGASDLVQEAIVRAHTGFTEFAGQSDVELQTWLRQILKNQLIDCTRAFRGAEKRDVDRERPLDDSSVPRTAASEPTPDVVALRNEEMTLLMHHIDELPTQERMVFRWYHDEELSFAEIGQRLECSSETVRRYWYRALARLAKRMGK